MTLCSGAVAERGGADEAFVPSRIREVIPWSLSTAARSQAAARPAARCTALRHPTLGA